MNKGQNNHPDNILAHFSLEPKPYKLRAITNGYINDTYLVLDNDSPKYILQRINHTVFTDVGGLMGNIDQALQLLENSAYRRISLVKTKSKNTFYKNGGYWRVMTYIDDSITYNTTKDPYVAFEAGRIIAKFHQLLETAKPKDFVDTIPKFHDLELRYVQFKDAFSQAMPEKLSTAESASTFVEQMSKDLKGLMPSELPLRICHNDTKLNNILFSKESNRALCLIDLDTLMKGYFYYDFGDAVRTIVNPAREDERNLSKVAFNKTLFMAFVKGLQSDGPFLTEGEIENLALGTVFMPFIHGLRALTDYLENNKYYKVSYEDQNLDRSLSLFDFTQKAWNQIDFMKGVIQKELIPVQ